MLEKEQGCLVEQVGARGRRRETPIQRLGRGLRIALCIEHLRPQQPVVAVALRFGRAVHDADPRRWSAQVILGEREIERTRTSCLLQFLLRFRIVPALQQLGAKPQPQRRRR